MQVSRNLTDPLDGFVHGKRLLILDRDQRFITEFCDLLKYAGTDVVRLPYGSLDGRSTQIRTEHHRRHHKERSPVAEVVELVSILNPP